jgi:predicted MFS family arabinose efflux permease
VLMNALALSRATMDSARVAGALSGAALTSALGIGPTYVAVTACYAASLALTLGVARRPPAPDPSSAGPAVGAPRPSGWGDLRDGLAHVLRTPQLLAVMCLAFVINLTAYPLTSGLLPYVARQVFRMDASGLGWLAASFAFGGLLASITMALGGGPRNPGRFALVHTAAWYALLLGFGHLRSAAAALLVLLVIGFVQNVAMISMTATLLAAAGDRFRSRVMGVRTLAVYGLPLGLIAFGALIDRVGYAATLGAASVIGLLVTVLIGARWRASLWHPRLSAAAPSVPQRA